MIVVLTAFGPRMAHAQSLGERSLSSDCIAAIQRAVADTAKGRVAFAEEVLHAALARSGVGAFACSGLILHNLATLALLSGRFAEGEGLAMRSIADLDRAYPPDHVALLRPLQVLISTRLEQGKKARAREVFQRLTAIRSPKPEQRAIIHGITGSLLQSTGDRRQAEVEFRAALDCWTESGRGETSDAAAVLTSIGTLYVEDRRYEDALQSLDRASAIFSRTEDSSPLDHSKLLGVRGTMHARRREWQSAENDFRSALSLIDGQARVDPAYVIALLTSLSEALDKNHRRQEGRQVKTRASTLRRTALSTMVVDVSDLVAQPKPVSK
jgi:tetratricopeptide (TPR) repeat protein